MPFKRLALCDYSVGLNPSPSLYSCIAGQDVLPLSFSFLSVKGQRETMCSTDPWPKFPSALRPKNSSLSEQLVRFTLTNTVEAFLMLAGCWEAESKAGIHPEPMHRSGGSCSFILVPIPFHAYLEKHFKCYMLQTTSFLQQIAGIIHAKVRYFGKCERTM